MTSTESAVTRPACRIYLSDLANTYYGVSPATIPLASGYIAAYLKKRFGAAVDVSIFRTLRSLREALRSAPPQIAGFSTYAWNPRITVAASAMIKEANPLAVTVAGGPSVELLDSMNRDYLLSNPNMDFLVRHEGEIAFANIVESFLEHGDPGRMKQRAIDGAFFLREGQLVTGRPVPLITPLEDTVPSPYLTGLFDELLKDEDLMPIMQTTRGCPYGCTFCVSGQAVYNKLRSFDIERVKEEILYLRTHAANRSIRFSDDNFGLLQRDVDIARFVREMFDAERYPTGLKIYYGKLINERIKECSLILKPLLPLCMSFQSLTPDVLTEIKRPNNSRAVFEDTRRWARTHDIAVATELIFGLPYESYDSFVKSLDGVVELRVDSVFPHGVWLLDGAELNTKESRQRYGYRTKFCVGADGITQYDDVLSVEYEEYVVESKWMTEEDFYKLNQLGLLAYWFLGYGFFKELLYHCVTSDIKLSDLFTEMLTGAKAYPWWHGLLRSYDVETRASFFETREDVERHIADTINQGKKVEVTRTETVYVGKMMSRAPEVLDELGRLIIALRRRQTGQEEPEFDEITRMLCDLTKHLLVPLGREVPEVITWRSPYDLVAWRREDYQYPVSHYRLSVPTELHLVMNNFAQTVATNAIISKLEDETMKIQYYLRNTNSSNVRRRIISASDAAQEVEMHLLNLEGFADAARSARPNDFY